MSTIQKDTLHLFMLVFTQVILFIETMIKLELALEVFVAWSIMTVIVLIVKMMKYVVRYEEV